MSVRVCVSEHRAARAMLVQRVVHVECWVSVSDQVIDVLERCVVPFAVRLLVYFAVFARGLRPAGARVFAMVRTARGIISGVVASRVFSGRGKFVGETCVSRFGSTRAQA